MYIKKNSTHAPPRHWLAWCGGTHAPPRHWLAWCGGTHAPPRHWLAWCGGTHAPPRHWLAWCGGTHASAAALISVVWGNTRSAAALISVVWGYRAPRLSLCVCAALWCYSWKCTVLKSAAILAALLKRIAVLFPWKCGAFSPNCGMFGKNPEASHKSVHVILSDCGGQILQIAVFSLT